MLGSGLIKTLRFIRKNINRILQLPWFAADNTISKPVQDMPLETEHDLNPNESEPATNPAITEIEQPDDDESQTYQNPSTEAKHDSGINESEAATNQRGTGINLPEEGKRTGGFPKKPADMPGRRGTSSNQKRNRREKPPESKPELICREVNSLNQWQILLKIPPDKHITVQQGESESELPPSQSWEYLLPNFTETIRWRMDNESDAVKLFNGTTPLIFKLQKNWKGDGRLVKHVSSGRYVVFAPREWTRNQPPPNEESQCSDSKFLAHFFSASSNKLEDGFNECPTFVRQKRFSLKGELVTDDSEQDDLFVGTSLELLDANDNNWQDISQVRVGEEGGGTWGETFNPTEKSLAEVLND